jgi:hypothetical protein
LRRRDRCPRRFGSRPPPDGCDGQESRWGAGVKHLVELSKIRWNCVKHQPEPIRKASAEVAQSWLFVLRRRLLDFSLLAAATIRRCSVPLYGWKVTRRDRAVASGRQAGRQRSSDRGIASESHGWRRIRGHGRGSGPRLNRTTSGTARGVTAPGYLRRGALGDAGRSLERQDASGEGHQAWRSDLAKAMWSQRPVRGSRERGRTAEDGRRP